MVFEPAIPFAQVILSDDTQRIQPLLPFLDQPAEKTVSARVRPVKPEGKKYLQDILWQESLLAIKVALDCQTVAELITRLQEKLPQNSAVTRRRNTTTILGRFFPTDDIDQLPRQVLRAYEDETLLAAVMRVLFLEAEPVVGKLMAERLYGLPAGAILPKDFFTQYTQEVLGKKDAHMSSRCRTATRLLGLTLAEKGRASPRLPPHPRPRRDAAGGGGRSLAGFNRHKHADHP